MRPIARRALRAPNALGGEGWGVGEATQPRGAQWVGRVTTMGRADARVRRQNARTRKRADAQTDRYAGAQTTRNELTESIQEIDKKSH